MYSVLIAEDELLIRMGLDASIPWNALQMNVVACVSDGQKAWEAYLAHKPDVVLTDLRMPGMDGLELIRRIRAKDSACRIFIITCIEDFDTLHEALSLDISGYMRKATIRREEIYAALKKVAGELEARGQGEGDGPRGDVGEESAALLARYTIRGEIDHAALARHWGGARGAEAPCAAVLLRLGDEGISPMLRQPVARIIQERAGEVCEHILLAEDSQLLLLPFGRYHEVMKALLEALSGAAGYMRTVFSLDIRVAACSLTGGYPALREGYLRLWDIVSKPYFYPERLVEAQGEGAPGDEALRACMRRLRTNPACYGFSGGEKKRRFLAVADGLEEAFGTTRARFETALEALAKCLPGEVGASTLLHRQSAPEALEALCALLPAYRSHPLYGEQILRTLEYMGAHLDEKITLSGLSSMVNLSANYYALLFKQTVGVSFSEYLMRLRIELACELLSQTALSIQEIAQRCGFFEAAYFTRCFKRAAGVSPKRWRSRR